MELKQHFTKGKTLKQSLLIVPYGIETRFAATVSALRCLLIVPYGIETKRGIYVAVDSTPLLIVPYGIETQIPAG